MKLFFVSVLLLLYAFQIKAQSITVDDLIKLVSTDYESSKALLSQTKGFNALPQLNVAGTPIEQFNKNGKPGVTELIVKSQWKDELRIAHKYVHYDVRPQSYAATIIEQLTAGGFSLKSKEKDEYKSVWLFEDQKYTFSIYTFSESKLPASIEIRAK